VLGVRLREHHQFDVGRVPACTAEVIGEIVDLVARQCEAERSVGPRDGGSTAFVEIDRLVRPWREMLEQPRGIFQRWETPLRSSGRGYSTRAQRARRLPADGRLRVATRYAIPRSMREIAVRLQLCAMSVAFDDQGEIVPGRGTTSRRSPASACAGLRGP